MPAMLDDPTAPVVYRTSGEPPYPTPLDPLPYDVAPKNIVLRDRITQATIVPFSSPDQVPPQLQSFLCAQLNEEIVRGDTYPMTTAMHVGTFGPYWFGNFGAVVVEGFIEGAEAIRAMGEQHVDWSRICLGSFYIKPNYPGRSSHVCNGGFLVTRAARNRGVGRLMGETYIEWAPKLGYTYSVFNLVYETNTTSCRIWDGLGFKRIGRVKGCGRLKSYPEAPVDAIIYGRDLGQDEDLAAEERFDKIKFYLKTGTYPASSDRAEKSRLRSAATHYKFIPAEKDADEKLLLKGKEVVIDPQKQHDIARATHFDGHGGINKTTAAIAEKYHWVRIKETVSAIIKNCGECNDATKAMARPEQYYRRINLKDMSETPSWPTGQPEQHHPLDPQVTGGAPPPPPSVYDYWYQRALEQQSIPNGAYAVRAAERTSSHTPPRGGSGKSTPRQQPPGPPSLPPPQQQQEQQQSQQKYVMYTPSPADERRRLSQQQPSEPQQYSGSNGTPQPPPLNYPAPQPHQVFPIPQPRGQPGRPAVPQPRAQPTPSQSPYPTSGDAFHSQSILHHPSPQYPPFPGYPPAATSPVNQGFVQNNGGSPYIPPPQSYPSNMPLDPLLQHSSAAPQQRAGAPMAQMHTYNGTPHAHSSESRQPGRTEPSLTPVGGAPPALPLEELSRPPSVGQPDPDAATMRIPLPHGDQASTQMLEHRQSQIAAPVARPSAVDLQKQLEESVAQARERQLGSKNKTQAETPAPAPAPAPTESDPAERLTPAESEPAVEIEQSSNKPDDAVIPSEPAEPTSEANPALNQDAITIPSGAPSSVLSSESEEDTPGAQLFRESRMSIGKSSVDPEPEPEVETETPQRTTRQKEKAAKPASSTRVAPKSARGGAKAGRGRGRGRPRKNVPDEQEQEQEQEQETPISAPASATRKSTRKSTRTSAVSEMEKSSSPTVARRSYRRKIVEPEPEVEEEQEDSNSGSESKSESENESRSESEVEVEKNKRQRQTRSNRKSRGQGQSQGTPAHTRGTKRTSKFSDVVVSDGNDDEEYGEQPSVGKGSLRKKVKKSR